MNERTARTQIQSAARAARILLFVAESQDGRTAVEVAERLDVSVPTAHHLLNTLVAEGFLVKESSRRFFLGPEIGALSDAFLRQMDSPEYLRDALKRLAEDTDETAYLSGWRNEEIVVLASVEGSHTVRVAGLHSGTRGFAHARASGKLLLAHIDDSALSTYLARNPLQPRTGRTIVSESALRADLEEIRRRGYSLDEEEFSEGVACVSAPVTNGETIVAALTLSAPAERFRQQRSNLIDAVVSVGRAASGA